MTITPVILCGGSGTRLWPLSRRSHPKQFVPLLGSDSLFQASVRRIASKGFGAPVVVTGPDFRFVVTEQLAAVGAQGTVLIEPEARNTAPAILAAALWAGRADPDALLLVAPSDHVIPDAVAFRAAVEAAAPAARAGHLVTFGIHPDRPETGYGWLELDEAEDGIGTTGKTVPLRRFVEKPDADTARRMLEAGGYLWNAGIFLFTAAAIERAYAAHAPATLAAVRAAVEGAEPDLDFFRLASEPWKGAEATSIDYAVMEKAENLAVMPYSGRWSDLGDWNAVWREAERDEKGVAHAGSATAIDCEGTLLRSEVEGQEIVGLGLRDVVAIAMPDAVLVAERSRAQEVRAAVDALKAKGARQATELPLDHRPWGWFESLATGDRFQVKRIVVKPGAALSLQSHHHRAEHWIVVEGTARVTVDDEVRLVTENESVYIPLGAVHRMENPGRVPMVLIEVQTGRYLGEDDILRYEDVYARGGGAKG